MPVNSPICEPAPDVVLVSPAVRTQQTWREVRAAWPSPPAERTTRALYEMPPAELLRLAEGEGAACVLLVGHNPNLPQFLGSLVTTPGRAAIRGRKGAIARIDCTRRPGTLHWLVDPRILRGVYGNATKDVRRRVSGRT